MQIVHPTLLARLQPGQPRQPAILVELYASDYIPPDSGFDSADAEELFAAIQITWNGHEYKQELRQNPSITKNQDKTPNSCTLSFSNLDRYMAAFIVNTEVEGMWCVVKYVERDITAGSIVTYVGRIDQPGELEMKRAMLSAKESLGAFADEIGTTFPLPGYRFQPQPGTFQQPVVDDQGREIRVFGRTLERTAQWSSMDSTHYGDVIPYILGRCQLDTHSIIDVDAGTVIKGLHYVSLGKLHDMLNIRQVIGLPYSQPQNVTKHLGEADGVGTQTVDPLFPNIGTTFPDLAYIGFEVTGSSPNAVDPPAYVVLVAVGAYALPDSSGDFTLDGATDNPAYLWRHFLSDPRTFNQPLSLIDDDSVLAEAPFCDERILDTTNAERRVLASDAFAAFDTEFKNYASTGLRETEYYRDKLGLASDDPFARLARVEEIEDIEDPPTPEELGTIPFVRKRYTLNVPITEKVKSREFLYNTFYQAFGGYHVTAANGKLQLRIKKPVDNTKLRWAILAGETSILVDDISAWRSSLAGEVLIGAHLTTSEVRKVTAANYSTEANNISLTASVSGTVTATASGATFSGGNNSSTPATATVTIGGTPADGDAAIVAISGVSVSYALNSQDTTGTVAAQLADLINADSTLKRFVTATWSETSPTIISLTSKIGTLTVADLEFAHDAAEEVMRVMFNFNNTNIKPDSFKYPLASRQKRYNQIEIIHREASNDFALQPPVHIDDEANQEQTKRINVFKMDGSAIDNYNQAYRRANIVFSEMVEGNKFATWKTKTGTALLAEEGDVGCVSDDGTGLRNYPVRAEEINISGEAEIAFVARQYSSTMFSDNAAAHDIRIPSIFKGAKPADVTNFVIDHASRSIIRLKWDIDPTETRILTFRLRRKDGAGSWTDAATVSGNTWTDHTPIIGSVTKWDIVALAGGARESETPTEVTLDVATFYGDTEPTGSIAVRDMTSVGVLVAPPAGMNDFGRVSVKQTRIRVHIDAILPAPSSDTYYWFDGGGEEAVFIVPCPSFKNYYNSIDFHARFEFAPGIGGDEAEMGSIGAFTTQADDAAENLAPGSTERAGALMLAENGEVIGSKAVAANDSRLVNVTSIMGTANQVGASASTGAVTIFAAQNIHNGATPTFAGLTLTNIIIVDTTYGFRFQRGTGTLAAGANDNVPLPAGKNIVTFTQSGAGGAYSVSGFSGNGDGRPILIYFNIPQTLTLKHDSASSASGQRLTIAGGVDRTFAAGAAVRCTIYYDQSVGAGIGYWVLSSWDDGS